MSRNNHKHLSNLNFQLCKKKKRENIQLSRIQQLLKMTHFFYPQEFNILFLIRVYKKNLIILIDS